MTNNKYQYKKSQTKKTQTARNIAVPAFEHPKDLKKILFFVSGAFLLTIILYSNTIFSGYALDDMVSITLNKYTQQGFSGIKNLFFKDSFDGYTDIKNLLSGGRYRPLALVTFAVEIGLFGKNIPHISHFINVFLFAISMAMLFLVCYRFIFSKKIIASAITTFFFIIHPIHTEVIANIKSRDEIMALLFSLITIYTFFKYLNLKAKKGWLVVSLVAYFLALLSKENAVMFIVFIFLMLFYFYKYNLKNAVKEVIPLAIVLFIFLFIRYSITGFHSNLQNEILNAPYLFATPVQAFATKAYILGKYLLLMFIPYPLSYIYTWNAVPYIGIGDIKFIIYFIVYLALIIVAIRGIKKRNPLSFFIINYILMLFLVSNFIIDIGALMGERFLYQAGLGLILAAGYYSDLLFSAIKNYFLKIFFITIISVISTVYIYMTFERNKVWKDENILYITDKDKYPSAHLRMNAGTAYFKFAQNSKEEKTKDSLFNISIKCFQEAIEIYPKYIDGYVNMGAAYFLKNNYDSAITKWDKAFSFNSQNKLLKKYFPIISEKFYLRAQEEFSKKEFDKTAKDFRIAMKHDSKYLQLLPFYYDKAKELFYNKKPEKAIEYIDIYLEFKQDNPDAFSLYADINLSIGNKIKAKEYYQKAFSLQPNNDYVRKQLEQLGKF